MNPIARILVPIYECRETYPAYEYATWLARTLKSDLLLAPVVKGQRLVLPCIGGPAADGAVCVDVKGIGERQAQLEETGARLAGLAEEQGIQAKSLPSKKIFDETVVTLSRQCDLLVDSRIHRRTVIERLLDYRDIYTDTCCPILVTGARNFSLNSTVLVYDGSKQASRALRWLFALAEHSRLKTLRVLVVSRKEVGRQVMSKEVKALAGTHNACVEIESAAKRNGCRKTAELAKELEASIVAMPAYAFPGRFGFRRVGMESNTLAGMDASLLLFT